MRERGGEWVGEGGRRGKSCVRLSGSSHHCGKLLVVNLSRAVGVELLEKLNWGELCGNIDSTHRGSAERGHHVSDSVYKGWTMGSDEGCWRVTFAVYSDML